MENDNLLRSVRLVRIPQYLKSHAGGLTVKELAELCGVSCRSIQRDIAILDVELHVPLLQDGRRYKLAGDYILPPVTFTLYESVALLLALRLAMKQNDKNNPHYLSALNKLSKVFPDPIDEHVKQAASIYGSKKTEQKMIKIFEQISFAWMAQRKIIFEYQSAKSSETHSWVLEPYFMDMSGNSSYVMGNGVREGKEGIMTFKLDRISKARLTDESFEIPQGINMAEELARSWGVIRGEGTDVVLKFSPAVTRRVKESVWHPSQRLENLADGGEPA